MILCDFRYFNPLLEFLLFLLKLFEFEVCDGNMPTAIYIAAIEVEYEV